MSTLYCQILSPDGVLACESWPALKELIIYDNPLTRTSKGILYNNTFQPTIDGITVITGMPQLLQDQLVNHLGVNIVR